MSTGDKLEHIPYQRKPNNMPHTHTLTHTPLRGLMQPYLWK